jgi:hypothetical protein
VGIVFTTCHADALRNRIVGAILDGMRDESCSAFYDATFANLLRKKRAKDPKKPEDEPRPKKQKGKTPKEEAANDDEDDEKPTKGKGAAKAGSKQKVKPKKRGKAELMDMLSKLRAKKGGKEGEAEEDEDA